MNGTALRQLAWRALPRAMPAPGGGLAHVNAGAAETLLWLQPPVDAGQLARARLARSGLVAGPAWTMLLDLAQAWTAQRAPEDLAAWTRIAEACVSAPPARDSAQAEAARVVDVTIALLALRRGGALQQLPPALLPALLDRIGSEVDQILRKLKPAGSERSWQLYAAYLAAGVLGPCMPRRGRSLAAMLAKQARELLVANLLADFRADGSHCERSPQRHRATLHTALSFVALARALDDALPPAMHARLRAALDYSLWSTLPDGGIPGGHADAAPHRALLALGAALYWLPSLEFAASGGGRGEPPDPLTRHFADAGRVVARSSWHDAQAQHLFHDCRGTAAGGNGLAFCYTIAGRRVVVDPVLERPLRSAAPTAPPLVRAGRHSLVVRSSAAAERGVTHSRCLAYVLHRYVLVVDRFHAPDGSAHPASLSLQFATDWQDRIGLHQEARGALLRGMAPRPCADWQVLLDAPDAQVELAESRGEAGPCLRARQDFRGETFLAAAIGPHGSALALHALEARHGAGRSVLCVSGESEGESFVDRLVVHWHEPGLVMRPDYLARAALALERRCAGKLQHLLLAQAGDWFSCLHPVHAPGAPDAAGDLEW